MAHDCRPYSSATSRRPRRRLIGIVVAVVLAVPAAVTGQVADDPNDGPQWQTDGFDNDNLETSGWTAVSTAGRGLATLENSTLVLRASGDLAADTWRSHDSLHLTRPAPNRDFVMRTTFGTVPVLPYEAQGLVFSSGEFDFLRIDVIGDPDGTGRRLYAASSTLGVPIVHASEPVTVTVPFDLQIRRDSDQWTVYIINAEGDRELVASFVHPMIIRSYGPFATSRDAQGRASFVGIDVLEGGGDPLVPLVVDEIPPLIQGVVVDNLDEGAVAVFTTDEETTGAARFTNSQGEIFDVTSTNAHDHRIIFDGAEQNEVYAVDVVATDAAGNSATVPVSNHIYAPPDVPIIEIYGGRDRVFGLWGDPQPTASVTGIVRSPTGLYTVRWRLDDGIWEPLVPNPDSTRVIAAGEFSIELEQERISDALTVMEIEVTELVLPEEDEGTELIPGPTNTISIDLQLLMSLDLDPDRTVSWTDEDLDRHGQIANGGWELVPGGVAPLEPGPQRIFLIGDQSWSDYEVELSFVAGDIALSPEPEPTQPWAGVYLGWRGFDPVASFSNEILPTSGGVGFGQGDSGLTVVGIRDELEFIANTGEVKIEPGSRYHIRAHAEAVQGGTEVRMKMWADGADEPEAWTVETFNQGTAGGGALALVAHRWDLVFETVTISPL